MCVCVRVQLLYNNIKLCDHIVGHAITGGICQVNSNCILVEDGGLTSSYTIAHEIGHRLTVTNIITLPYIIIYTKYDRSSPLQYSIPY